VTKREEQSGRSTEPDPIAAALTIDILERIGAAYREAIGRVLRQRVREDAKKALR
jgi:hypothetical protein